MKVRNRRYYSKFTGSAQELQRILLNATPQDGCLLVFNASHRHFRKTVSMFMRKILRVHNIGGPLTRATNNTGITDLYIVWREQ